MKKCEQNYRQNVEAELIGMVIGIAGMGILVAGTFWALVLLIRWFLV